MIVRMCSLWAFSSASRSLKEDEKSGYFLFFLYIYSPCTPMFGQLFQAIARLLSVLPKSILHRVAGPNDIAKPGQPSIRRIILGMCMPGPKSLESHLVFRFLACTARILNQRLNVHGILFAKHFAQRSVVHVPVFFNAQEDDDEELVQSVPVVRIFNYLASSHTTRLGAR